MGVLHWPFDPSGLRPKKISVRFLVLQGAERPASACARSRSENFLGFETLTIVFLIQNYRAFVRGRLAKIPISSPEFLIFGDRRR